VGLRDRIRARATDLVAKAKARVEPPPGKPGREHHVANPTAEDECSRYEAGVAGHGDCWGDGHRLCLVCSQLSEESLALKWFE